MKINKTLFDGYENTRLVRYDDPSFDGNTVAFSDLPNTAVQGVLKCSRRVNGKLIQTYSEQENHVGVIAATRLGKTTSYVIPTIISFARQKVKRSMIISDPKGELYRNTAATLAAEGYRVKLLNFRDYLHSECWNMLTPIFRKYRAAMEIGRSVEVVETPDGPRNKFNGVMYDDQTLLDDDIERTLNMHLDEVGNDIDNLASMFIQTRKQDDPYWEDSARDVLKAFLWAMLEDSDPKCDNPITEDTYSFDTILRIIGTFKDGDGTYYDDDGYFSSRKETSRALMLAKNTIIENGRPTRKCIMATLNTKLSVFRECAMRLITCCNSFYMTELTGGPIAIFIDYRDELKVHYDVISLFIQDAYRYLIEQANLKQSGKLDVPVYFILDEFGNFPAIKDFETTISACAGRNIFFILIIQSYAQLNSVYGNDVAEIIRDNLNVHVFFGSNNPSTLKEFSTECGQQTRISPLSALNGEKDEIDHYQLETIPLVPISMLAHFAPGECIVTEANSGYVMYSMLERYYMSEEFAGLPLSDEKQYTCSTNPFDKRYTYTVKKKKKDKSSPFDDLF
ncbi:MAG: type IV secretory system conjugative DNA transfer family protein [Clostridia bacterium]|nr:type IV secretory system conjugative DNA transfer family protein [Clostridia bacterium]